MSSSFVFASLRSSVGIRPPHHSVACTDVVLLIRRTVRPRGYASRSRSLRLAWDYARLGAPGLGGREVGHFKHPATILVSQYQSCNHGGLSMTQTEFYNSLLDRPHLLRSQRWGRFNSRSIIFKHEQY